MSDRSWRSAFLGVAALCLVPQLALAESDVPVRAVGGNWGIFFRGGGLANLTLENEAMDVAGGGDAGLLIAQVGVRAVLNERWIIPFHVGMGARIVSPEFGDAETDFGLDVGGGFEYHFRIWRRISPFVGASLRLGVNDPAGDAPGGDGNWTIAFGLYPTMGVEYYVGDRVSLIMQYLMGVDMAFSDASTTVRLFNTRAGGALSVSFYF